MATLVSLNSTVNISLAVGDDCYIESTGGYASVTVAPVYQQSDIWRVGPSRWRRRFGPYSRRTNITITNNNAVISYETTVDTVGGAPTGSQVVTALDAELGGTDWRTGNGGGSGDMTMAAAQTVTGAKTFGDAKLILAGATSGNTTLKASDGAGDITITLPASGPTTLVGRSTTDTLTNKTINSPVLGGTLTGTYTIGGTPTFPAAVVTLTGTQTLTNKTLTAPVLTTPALGTPASGNLSNCTAVPAAQISGVIPIANLATGTPTGSKFIRDDGTLQAIAGGGDALVANPLSQFAATTSAQLAGVISDETGSGALVFGTSPALTTPNLGTPSAATLTNATGLPIATGVSGLGTGVATFLGTPSSANLAAAVTGETGSGALVFGTAPTISALTATGITTYDGAVVITPNAMAGLAIDTSKPNTKSISADSTFTFSAQPAADTWFTLYVANTDTAPHILTIPSCFSMVTQGNRTTMPIAASGQLYLVFRHSGSGNYKVMGDSPFFNKYDATTAPGVGDDVADGYGPGSLWYDATGNALYICESNGAGAAVWTALGGGSGDMVLASAQTVTGAKSFNDSTLILKGSSSGTSTLKTQATAGTVVHTLPTIGETLGYCGIPQVSQSAAYTCIWGDAGRHILHPSADTTARTFTIPANSSVGYPIGTTLTFINQNSAGVVTIAITTDTMRLAGAGTTGSRTLAANGIATAVKLTSTEWIISGTGIS